ncbi:MAG: hypothetical protein V4578_17970 [Pseudomonadota bacterium]
MLKHSSYLFSLGSGLTFIALLYAQESAIGNLLFSAPIDIMLLCFSAGAVLAIFSKASLEAKLVKCIICLAPAMLLLSRLPAPL